MSGLLDPPSVGQRRAPSDAPGAALNFRDPEALRVWLTALQDAVDDAVAVGEDATRSPKRRDLGRRMARRLLRDARRSLGDLLTMAERGLDTGA